MKTFGITHRGAVRKENQDCFRIDMAPDGSFVTAVLCDGMGGAQAGSIASGIAADTFMSHAANSLDGSSTAGDMRAILTEAVSYANIRVYDRSFSDFACMGMGSTLVALVMNAKRAMVANVGDSRAYLLARGRVTQISRDHSLVEDMLERGQITREQAKNHPQKNIITRAVGVEASVRCDIFEPKLMPGSRLLLCSDGLSNLLSENDILSISEKNSDVERCCRLLLELALDRGAPDNVTVLISEK